MTRALCFVPIRHVPLVAERAAGLSSATCEIYDDTTDSEHTARKERGRYTYMNKCMVTFLGLAFEAEILRYSNHINSLHKCSDRKGGFKATFALRCLGRGEVDDMR